MNIFRIRSFRVQSAKEDYVHTSFGSMKCPCRWLKLRKHCQSAMSSLPLVQAVMSTLLQISFTWHAVTVRTRWVSILIRQRMCTFLMNSSKGKLEIFFHCSSKNGCNLDQCFCNVSTSGNHASEHLVDFYLDWLDGWDFRILNGSSSKSSRRR